MCRAGGLAGWIQGLVKALGAGVEARRRCLPAFLLVALCGAGCAAGPSPVAAERCALTAAQQEASAQYASEINLLRSQPAAYADIIQTAFTSMGSDGIFLRGGMRTRTREGRAAVDEAVAELRRQAPRPALTLNRCLSASALAHALHVASSGSFSHVGVGGSSPSDRASREAGHRLRCGETISMGAGSARDHVIALVVDDGQGDRGHRKALLSETYRSLGAAVTTTRAPGQDISVQVLCVDAMSGS